MQEVVKRERTNNEAGLAQKLVEFKLDKLPWIERLDMMNKPAALAPELAYQEDQHLKDREKAVKNSAAAAAQGNKNKKKKGDSKSSSGPADLSADPVHNDFKREMLFYRQAQAAVFEGLARLKSMGVATKRPDDYFAQMAKTDEHMQKIRQKLVTKQVTEERLEKVRKLRELKKYGKKVQAEVQLKRQKEKKEMLDQVKKFRKGQTDTIDFLEEGGGKGAKGKKAGGANNQGYVRRRIEHYSSSLLNYALFYFPSCSNQDRRKFKDKKFGFGGKKKGGKANTRESVNDVSGFRPGFKKRGADSGLVNRSGAAGKNKGNKRLGKSRRKQAKAGGRGKKK